MQFAVLVYEKPGTYEALSAAELEQMTARVSRDRAAPGLHRGCSAAVDRDGERGARRGRRDVDHRRPVCEYQGGLWRLLPLRGGESRSGARDRGSLPRGSARRGSGGPSVGASPRHGRHWLIERVFRERWGRVLASMVGYVGDFDLAEESTQEALAIGWAARDDRDDQRMGRLGGPGPDRARRTPAPARIPAPTCRPTACPPRTSCDSSRPQPRRGHRRRDRALRRPLPRPSTDLLCGRVGHLGGGARAPALRAQRSERRHNRSFENSPRRRGRFFALDVSGRGRLLQRPSGWRDTDA